MKKIEVDRINKNMLNQFVEHLTSVAPKNYHDAYFSGVFENL